MTKTNTQHTQQGRIVIQYTVKTPTGSKVAIQAFTIRDKELMLRHIERYATK